MSDYVYYDPAFVPAGFGLNNAGAICWCNSLIQLLLGIPALNRVLLENETDLLDNVFATEYIKLVKAGLSIAKGGSPPPLLADSSKLILDALSRQAVHKGVKLTIGWGQECADEGFSTFIQMFDCNPVERLFSNVYELRITCSSCERVVSSIRDKAVRIPLHTRGGLTDQKRFCDYLRIHLNECDYFKCECGHVMTKFQRSERLKMIREIVVIVFNKYQHKDNRWFPQELSFLGTNGKELKYKIVGKIEHSGTHSSGHYWAQSLRGGSWICMNDSAVTSGNQYPTAETFMIAYSLVAD